MTGVRRWAGNDLIELQQQPLQAIDAFFAQYGNCILKGCEVQAASDNTYNITPGFVALAGTDQDNNETFKVVPFAGIEGVTLPIYFTLIHSIIERPYTDGKVKPVAYDFRAAASSILPENVPYLEISVTGGRQFVDAIRLTEKLDQTGNGRDVTVTFAQAAKRENIFSGEKLSVLWGKVCRWLTDLKDVAFSGKAADLTQDTKNRLVSDTEKTGWNDKYTKTETDAKLKGKADSAHVHEIENITNLQSKLDEKYPKTGFGNLSINASGIPIIKNNSSYAAFTATGAPVDILSIKENNDIYVGYRNSILHLLGTSVKNAAGNDFFHSGNLIPYALQDRGTEIPVNSDLNDYKTFGSYFVEASQIAVTVKNTPWTTNGYRLIVQAGYGEKMWLYQIAYGSSEIAYRIANTALVFTEWRYVPDKASLYTALSNKANTNHTHYSLSPQQIPENSDLNDYTTPGMYYCRGNAIVATLLNRPTLNAFSLLVEKHAGTRQTLTEHMREPFKIFVRNEYADGWGPWQRIYTTIDKPTPAEIGAAAASHIHPYEPAFIKNSAFNKDFGTRSYEVARGDHTHSRAVRFVAQYQIVGSPNGTEFYKMSGDEVLLDVARAGVGRYGIRHNMNTLDYIVILDGNLTNTQQKPAKVSLMEQNNLLISVVCSDNETPKDSSFYITILRY